MNPLKKMFGPWYDVLEPVLTSEDFKAVRTFLKFEMASGYKIYPKQSQTFRAFSLCPPEELRVVILGQDPYHDGSANGLCFANNDDAIKISPSLRSIITAVETDYDTLCLDFDHSLESWAEQGVLLLNTALTVRKGIAGSHLNVWRPFTENVLKIISFEYPKTIFVLWGKKAQAFKPLLHTQDRIVEAPHPAAELYAGGKAGFYSSQTFRRINVLLDEPIIWDTSCAEKSGKKDYGDAPY